MKRLFLDTNVLIDVLQNREPFSRAAVIIFNDAEHDKYSLYLSSHSLATAYYFCKKVLGDAQAREYMLNLCNRITVVPVDRSCLIQGFKSTMPDAEDAIQLAVASTVDQLDAFITRNLKDFKNSPIRVLSPEQVLLQL